MSVQVGAGPPLWALGVRAQREGLVRRASQQGSGDKAHLTRGCCVQGPASGVPLAGAGKPLLRAAR